MLKNNKQISGNKCKERKIFRETFFLFIRGYFMPREYLKSTEYFF